jgi:AAA15 family ATPase/GTPase
MIHGIEIADYRSIGDMQHIAPLGKINLFVGPNNSGKSNILRFINENLVNLFHTIKGTRQGAALQSQPHLFRNANTLARLGIRARCTPA